LGNISRIPYYLASLRIPPDYCVWALSIRIGGNTARVMCPDGEGPGFVADKVGVEAGNGKVIGTLFQH